MNSNLHMRDLLLPIGVMNVISIIPLLLLAPLIELVTSCCLAMGKAPMAPVRVISMYLFVIPHKLTCYCNNLYNLNSFFLCIDFHNTPCCAALLTIPPY